MQDNIIEEIIAAGQRLAAQGLTHSQAGNISCRIETGNILITASGINKGKLSSRDVLLVDDEGHMYQGSVANRPSSETALHVALYRKYAHIAAIVHAHPPYATALSCTDRELDWRLLEETVIFLGPVPLLPRFKAGSLELAQATAQAAAGVNALLLAGHGVISWGENIEQALSRMEIIEHTAQVMMLRTMFEQTGTDHV